MRISLRAIALRATLRLRRLAPIVDASLVVALGIGIILLLERSGRLFATEYWDLLLSLAALIGGALGLWWIRLRRPEWIDEAAARLSEKAAAIVRAARVSVGVDFRPDGPIRLAPFRATIVANTILLLTALGLIALGRRYGHLLWQMRESLPFTIYLAVVSLQWLLLVTLDVGAVLFLYLLARLWLARHTSWQRERRVLLALVVVAGAAAMVCCLDQILGVWALISLMAVTLAAPLAVSLAGAPPGYAFTVRRESTGRIYTLPTTTLFITFTQSVILIGLVVTVVVQDYRFLPPNRSFDLSMIPVTHLLGRVFGWLAALVSIQITADTLHAFFVRRPREDPSLARPTRVWIAPDLDPPDRQARLLLHDSEIDVVSGPWRRFAGQVDLVLYSQERPDDIDDDIPAYPVGAEAWQSPALSARLRRLDARSCRRRFFRSLRELHRQATSRRYRTGEGFFLAPHCWLIEGLTRDQSDDDTNESIDWEDDLLEIIGPPYHRILGARLRRFLHRVFRSCRIDLVFWQDGVSIDALIEVLERLFQHHETHGASRPMEERDLIGVLGVSTHIQEIGFEEPLVELEGYREPDYEDISRARVLLVLRDGGGDDDAETPPPPLDDREDRDRWLRDTLRKALPRTLAPIGR